MWTVYTGTENMLKSLQEDLRGGRDVPSEDT